MNCKATIIRDGDDYIITDVLTHVVTFGSTKKEAIDNLKSAMEEYYDGLNDSPVQIAVIE